MRNLKGWKKQHSDPRDRMLRLHPSLLAAPSSADNRLYCSPVEDQGDLGSCTAHMFAGLVECNEIRRQGLAAAAPAVTVSNVQATPTGLTFQTTVAAGPPVPPPKALIRVARLFEYYATRQIEGTVAEDSGATIRDAVKAGARFGVANEASWPYDIAKFTARPPAAVWSAALSHRVTAYHAIADGDTATMRSTLAMGLLVGFGFQVYDAMLSDDCAKSGLLCRPRADESLQGGHAVCLVGYDDAKAMPDGSTGAFLVRNSWGAAWGQQGYYWQSYDYVGDSTLASDFWVVQSAPI